MVASRGANPSSHATLKATDATLLVPELVVAVTSKVLIYETVGDGVGDGVGLEDVVGLYDTVGLRVGTCVGVAVGTGKHINEIVQVIELKIH